jgi:hypothetical protein
VNWRSESLRLEKGKVYRVRYVYLGESVVSEAMLRFDGEILSRNRPMFIIAASTDTVTQPGAIDILGIDEMTIRGEVWS